MITFPHSLAAVPVAPVVALAVSLAGAAGLGKRGAPWAPAVGAAAALAGFALLVPAGRLGSAVLAPRAGVEALLAPAAVCVVGAALVAWRGRPSRWVAVAVAGFAGWWLARAWVGPGEFWRVLFGVAALAWVLSRVVAGQAWRAGAAALSLWGGLAVAGGGMAGSALVVAAAGLGLAVRSAVLPMTLLAAAIAAADLAGGQLLRGRIDAVDLACVLALLAPVVAGMIETRLGKRAGRSGPAIAAAAGAGLVAGSVWLLRRAFFT